GRRSTRRRDSRRGRGTGHRGRRVAGVAVWRRAKPSGSVREAFFMERKVTVPDLQRMKEAGTKITALTAYDFPFAQITDQAGIDVILVGDTLGMVVQGLETTLPVTLDEVIYHCRMVARGRKRALLVGDLPFGSYQTGPDRAVESAVRLVK